MNYNKGLLERCSNSKGISLIALIITIIVIVLLAAIVVNTSINTPQSASLAKFMQDMGEMQQAVSLSYMDEYTLLATQNGGEVDKDAIYENIARGAESISVVYGGVPPFEEMGITGATTAWKINDTTKIPGLNELPNYGSDYYITNNGNVFLEDGYINGEKTYYTVKPVSNTEEVVTPPTPPPVVAEPYVDINNWDMGKLNTYVEETIGNVKYLAPIPLGYVASTDSEEDSISEGLVIKEGNDGTSTTSNEFVWIPVLDVEQMYTSGASKTLDSRFPDAVTTMWGKSSYETMGDPESELVREPDVITKVLAVVDGERVYLTEELDYLSSNLQKAGFASDLTLEDFANELIWGFEDMISSVEIYGGFYVGRYELGFDSGVVSKRNKNVLVASETSGTNCYGSPDTSTWYGLYNAAMQLSINNVAMSSMIWGCQWDTIINWISNEQNINNSSDYYINNSAGMGNYSRSLSKTGVYAVRNIYDMAGNVWDWTLEAGGSGVRIVRGGDYTCVGNNGDAPGNRSSYSPEYNYLNIGTRATLYILPY